MAKKKRRSTGMVGLDLATGGGIPEGARVEIFGKNDCGKTTIALEISKAYKKPYYIDFESKVDEEYTQIINPAINESAGNLVDGLTFEDACDDLWISTLT